jgi:putative spermidine/putrescine transport system ATP-binding protein
MDEPLGALDKKLRDAMQLEIKRLHRELGSTILYVTHDQGEAMSMSDRVALMRDAKIEQIGSPYDLYFNPESRFAGDFFGGTNFLPATVIGNEGARVILSGPCGSTIKANHRGESLPSGAAATVMIRPQHLSVDAEPVARENSLSGVVTESVLIGMTIEHFVRLPDGTSVVVVELSSAHAKPLSAGTPVNLTWKIHDAHVFSAEAQ